MTDIVFLEPNKIDTTPFTTSDVIAEYAQVGYRSVQRLIEKHENDLSEFGRVRFEITPFETKGGTQDKKIYRLNEEQATLLITYLKNTLPVREFKKKLVRQFYLMRSELLKRQINRCALKPIRKEMTDAISENEPNSRWAYKKYTDLAYKIALGKNAAQLRRERNAPRTATAVDYMSADEIKQVAQFENRISVLLEMGMTYYVIKALLESRKLAKQPA